MITEGRTELSLFTATRSFIKPKSGCVTFHACLHCLLTIYAITKYWQKA